MELTILMPCLNEAETLAVCIRKAREFLRTRGVSGEVLIADNGSTDGSVSIALAEGARVVQAPVRGYGSALIHGIKSARGRYVVMGDADDSYDFLGLDPFLQRLRAGDELVMGNRFKGGISRGAMPFLHRYLGNPVLSFIGRLFFHVPIGDFHCGLRGFARERMLGLTLVSPGMEFASEMIVKAQLQGLRITEVATTLRPDGRSRAPHLKTWSDGWRHLKFLLLHSPRWLFLYPGAICFFVGLLLTAALYAGPRVLTFGVTLDVHSLIVGCLLMLVGAQSSTFGLIAHRHAVRIGLLPMDEEVRRPTFTMERMLMIAALLMLIGFIGLGHNVWAWSRSGFGSLNYASLVRPVMISGTTFALGFQLLFTAFLSALIDTEPARPMTDAGE
jgi:glycosyltransferase involved in cell wall biosynthesis